MTKENYLQNLKVWTDGVYDNGIDLYKLVRYPIQGIGPMEQINLLNDYPILIKLIMVLMYITFQMINLLLLQSRLNNCN